MNLKNPLARFSLALLCWLIVVAVTSHHSVVRLEHSTSLVGWSITVTTQLALLVLFCVAWTSILDMNWAQKERDQLKDELVAEQRFVELMLGFHSGAGTRAVIHEAAHTVFLLEKDIVKEQRGAARLKSLKFMSTERNKAVKMFEELVGTINDRFNTTYSARLDDYE